MILQVVQEWLFRMGAGKGYGAWDRLGNLLQDIRTKISRKG